MAKVEPDPITELRGANARIDWLEELLHRIAVARRGDCPDVDENWERLPHEIEELWELLRMERDAHLTMRGL